MKNGERCKRGRWSLSRSARWDDSCCRDGYIVPIHMAITPNFSSNFQRHYTSGRARLLAWKNGRLAEEGGGQGVREPKSNLPHSSIHNPKLLRKRSPLCLTLSEPLDKVRAATADIGDGISNEQWRTAPGLRKLGRLAHQDLFAFLFFALLC